MHSAFRTATINATEPPADIPEDVRTAVRGLWAEGKVDEGNALLAEYRIPAK